MRNALLPVLESASVQNSFVDPIMQRNALAQQVAPQQNAMAAFAPGGAPVAQGGFGTASATTRGNRGGRRSSGLFDLIDRVEGGGRYDTLFGHSQNGGRFDGVDVSQMTLGELRQFADPGGEYGQWVRANNPEGVVATPMGRHQIVGTTLRRTAQQLGFGDDTVFSPQVQDQMANHLARARLASATTMEGKMRALRNEWAGFKHVSDADLARAIREYERT